MALTLDQPIEHKQKSWLSRQFASQTFWVFVAVILACLFLSVATDSFATSKNLYNITRNVTFVAIIALGMTIVIITGGIDLSVGSVLCLCSMVLATTMHSGQPIYVGIAALIVQLDVQILGQFQAQGLAVQQQSGKVDVLAPMIKTQAQIPLWAGLVPEVQSQ